MELDDGRVPSGIDAERPPRPRRARWGVRTVCLVGFAFVCLQASTWLAAAGTNNWASLATLTAIVALVCAAYCSYRGLRGFSWLPR